MKLKKWLAYLGRLVKEFWECAEFKTKFHMVLIGMTVLFCSLAFMTGRKDGEFFDIVRAIGTIFLLVAMGYILWFVDFMFRTPTRRRIFYLMIIFGLFGAAILTMWFGDEDTNVEPIMMAAMFSVVLLVPAFISYWHFPYRYDDDDDN